MALQPEYREWVNTALYLTAAQIRLKMIETARVLNDARNKAGWELADQIEAMKREDA
jgi:hypothetical protein